jgi:hypothetical protein
MVTAVDAGPVVGQCTAHTTAGNPCRRQAIKGGTVCYVHGGAAPQTKAAAHRRLAEAEAAESIRDVVVAPISNPLEALAEVAEEARAWQGHIAAKVAELDAMDGMSPVSRTEYLRPLVALYERSMDRTAKFLADWVRLGFDERMVALHERQADLVDRFLTLVLDDLDLDEQQAETAAAAKVRHLHVLTEAA